MLISLIEPYNFTQARSQHLEQARAPRNDNQLRGPQASPYAQAEKKIELQAVLGGSQKLPEIDRAALLMRAFVEMPYEEIARALRILLAYVKVKIHHARLALGGIGDP